MTVVRGDTVGSLCRRTTRFLASAGRALDANRPCAKGVMLDAMAGGLRKHGICVSCSVLGSCSGYRLVRESGVSMRTLCSHVSLLASGASNQ